jgi:hypothetical protein
VGDERARRVNDRRGETRASGCPPAAVVASAGFGALPGVRETVCVRDEDVRLIADLLRERNAIDAKIAEVIGRPMTAGHLGEWIAATVFDIALERAANLPGLDGRFRAGPLAGRTVNVKWYLKREGLLDVTQSDALDYYLVLAGPPGPAAHSRGAVRPWMIDAVYLFDVRVCSQSYAPAASRPVSRPAFEKRNGPKRRSFRSSATHN